MQRFIKKSDNMLERVAIRIPRWIGSTNSLLVHTALFIVSFVLYFYGIGIDKILLVLTTLVSLEAIYLSIFIQMSVNRQSRRLHAVSKDVDEIQKDIEEIQEDVEGIEKDVDEIQEDVDEIQKDVEEIEEDDEHKDHEVVLTRIEGTLSELMKEINELKKK